MTAICGSGLQFQDSTVEPQNNRDHYSVIVTLRQFRTGARSRRRDKDKLVPYAELPAHYPVEPAAADSVSILMGIRLAAYSSRLYSSMGKGTWIECPGIYKVRNCEKQYYTDALAAILCIAMLVIVTMNLAGVRHAKGMPISICRSTRKVR
ncbi:MAG: hypothetical protein ABI167_00955 [Nitrosospira sp.]